MVMRSSLDAAKSMRDCSSRILHTFASKWQRESDGFWRSAGGRRLSDASYQKHVARLKQRESRPAKAAAAKPAATNTTPQQTAAPAAQYKPDDLSKAVAELKRREQIAASTKRIKGVESKVMPGLIEKSKAKVAEIEKSLRASGNLPPAASIGAVKPAPSPMQTITNEVEKAYAQDQVRFGTKSANVIRRVSQLFLGALGAGGGAAIGATLGIPFGPAGVATGAVAGGLLGARSLTGVPRELQSANRIRATARKAARAVVPPAVGSVAAIPAVPAGLAGAGAVTGLALTPIGMMTIGRDAPEMVAASVKAGFQAPMSAARGVQRAMATSRVGARKSAGVKSDMVLYRKMPELAENVVAKEAKRRGKSGGTFVHNRGQRGKDPVELKFYSELPASNPLVAVIRDRLKQLLAQSGQQFPEPTDEQILAAIAKVSE
jgi:hypothetical protein